MRSWLKDIGCGVGLGVVDVGVPQLVLRGLFGTKGASAGYRVSQAEYIACLMLQTRLPAHFPHPGLSFSPPVLTKP